MTVKFNINYKTAGVQKLFVLGNIPQLGNNDVKQALELTDIGNGKWHGSIEITGKSSKKISYSYFVGDEINYLKKEWGEARELTLNLNWSSQIEINDQWRPSDVFVNNYHTSPFKDVFFKSIYKEKAINKKLLSSVTHRFTINIPFDLQGKSICILGSSQQFGSWSWSNFLPMTYAGKGNYILDLNMPISDDTLFYKYGIYDPSNSELIELEAGLNRSLLYNKEQEESKFLVNDNNFIKEFDQWKGAGVAIPVFSLRSKSSLGVGEFQDLKLMVDWAVKTGMKLIQILPINDTIANQNWVDSYPYAAISVFALHPIYINLEKTGKLKSTLSNKILQELKDQLNENQYIDYEKVMNSKMNYLRLLFDEKRDELISNDEYQKFVKDNSHWLESYAAFSFLRDTYQTVEFSKWGKYSTFSKKILSELCNPKSDHFKGVELYYFIQYHLHLQLLEATDYAHKNNVILKGDIPIGIYRNSVDAWTDPHLYNMEMQAGAPPDDFAVKGQNWGFPTYNWDEMSKDGYTWWTNRLKKLADYFDTFRIDHILGFFRIWQIPMHAVEGILGYFNPAIAIEKEEFLDRGLNFSSEKFCQPMINDRIIGETFGEKYIQIRDAYFESIGGDNYKLKSEFDTQRKVENYFVIDEATTLEEKAEIEFIKKGLFNIIADIMFIEIELEGRIVYHPRHSLTSTNSFKALNDKEKEIVQFIYNDYFFNRQEQFWRERAMEKLPSIKDATNMLICGEDLGMVPAVVPGVMNELGILSLEVQRMPKDTGIEFFDPTHAPYQSVVTCSSHDMSTVRGWWGEDYDRSQRFYNQILKWEGQAPKQAEASIVEAVVAQHMYSPAMWSILPIQDFVGMDDKLKFEKADQEQINIPANIPHYWRYRFHMNMEDLLKEDDFNNRLKQMIVDSGR
jgi:4-alpha-glucanotransferase